MKRRLRFQGSLVFFLLSLALDAEGGYRPGFEAFIGNRFAAFLADAVSAVLDPLQGGLDFFYQSALPFLHAEREGQL